MAPRAASTTACGVTSNHLTSTDQRFRSSGLSTVKVTPGYAPWFMLNGGVAIKEKDVGADVQGPAIHTHREAVEPVRERLRQQDREEHNDLHGGERGGEYRQDDVVRDREQPADQDQPAARGFRIRDIERDRVVTHRIGSHRCSSQASLRAAPARALLAEAERGVAVGDEQEGVGAHPQHPAVPAHDQIEQLARVAAREEDREPGDHRDHDHHGG